MWGFVGGCTVEGTLLVSRSFTEECTEGHREYNSLDEELDMEKRFVIYLFVVLASTCVHAQERVLDVSEVDGVVDAWHEALNTRDVSALRALYAEEVMFYGRTLPKDSCLMITSQRLESSEYRHHRIIARPVVSVFGDDVIRASFVLQVTSGAVVADHDAYLLIKRFSGELKIMGESDLATDEKTGFVPDIGSELNTSLLSVRNAQVEENFWRRVNHVLLTLLCGVGLVGLAFLVWRWRKL